ncbi:MAG: hypothetical protein WCH46_06485 [bacterium]
MRNYESAKIHTIRVIGVLFFFASLFLASQSVVAQGSNPITNYFTEKYRDFPMLHISIIPPTGFEKDTVEPGFIKRKDRTYIRAIELKEQIDSAFKHFFVGLDTTGEHGKYLAGMLYLPSGPIKVLEAYDFRINHYQAHLVKLSEYTDRDDYYVWTLFIGDSTHTTMVNGFFPKSKAGELDSQIRTSLLSVFYEPDRRILLPGADPTTTSSSGCNCHNKN